MLLHNQLVKNNAVYILDHINVNSEDNAYTVDDPKEFRMCLPPPEIGPGPSCCSTKKLLIRKI